MMIKFAIKNTNKLATGLNFQLVYAKSPDIKSWCDFTSQDFDKSISVNDKAFNLVFANFYNNQNEKLGDEYRWAYAYGENFHDKASVAKIINELVTLKSQIENSEIPVLEDRYFYTKKVQKILSDRRIRYKYQPKILNFLDELIQFLQVAIDDDKIVGIYSLGI